MKLREITKSENEPRKLILTIEDPETGEKERIQSNFFSVCYIQPEKEETEIVVGHIIQGRANILERMAMAKTIKAKVAAELISSVSGQLSEEKDPDTQLLATLFLGSLFSD